MAVQSSNESVESARHRELGLVQIKDTEHGAFRPFKLNLVKQVAASARCVVLGEKCLLGNNCLLEVSEAACVHDRLHLQDLHERRLPAASAQLPVACIPLGSKIVAPDIAAF